LPSFPPLSLHDALPIFLSTSTLQNERDVAVVRLEPPEITDLDGHCDKKTAAAGAKDRHVGHLGPRYLFAVTCPHHDERARSNSVDRKSTRLNSSHVSIS